MNFLASTILSGLSSKTFRIAELFDYLRSNTGVEHEGVYAIMCMDARLNLRRRLQSGFVVPNPYAPAGGIVEAGNLAVEEDLLVASKKFNMKHILIVGHSDCGAMAFLRQMLRQDTPFRPLYEQFNKPEFVSPISAMDADMFEKPLDRARFDANLSLVASMQTAHNVMDMKVPKGADLLKVAELVANGDIKVHIGHLELTRSKFSGIPDKRLHLYNEESGLFVPQTSFVDAIKQDKGVSNPQQILDGMSSYIERIAKGERLITCASR
jgi:carbonic anhydrase